MVTLSSGERSQLERVVLAAREVAERGVRKRFAALDLTGINAPAGLTADDRTLRNALRDRSRKLGRGRIDALLATHEATRAGEPFLIEELAYETWHRMLFARYLAENDLLIHPEYNVALSIEDVAELAAEQGIDPWELAADIASHRLPGLFRLQTPLQLASEDRQDLTKLLVDMESDLFTATDSLGWVYQYWQSKRKDEVNASGDKITGNTLSPVTQLFTEDYMVDFLLQNSLGAWYVSRNPETTLKANWKYLRFREDGTPAAGTFPTWPETVAEVTVIDPCCGSGHFLVAALHMLVEMRQEQEGLTSGDAVDAVLRDNLFGLELDARCTQIATFAVAMEAWKLGGHPETNLPHIACSGIPVSGQKDDWIKLAKGDDNLKVALENLYEQFSQASELGSLINPKRAISMAGKGKKNQQGFALAHDWDRIEQRMLTALERDAANDPASSIFNPGDDDLVGTIRAAQLLGRSYTLVVTNVPFLGLLKQGDSLRAFANSTYPPGKSNLATVFLLRLLDLISGDIALLLPDGWFLQSREIRLRSDILLTTSLKIVAKLGMDAFTDGASGTTTVSALIVSPEAPSSENEVAWIDMSQKGGISHKSGQLRRSEIVWVSQQAMTKSPSFRIEPDHNTDLAPLKSYATGLRGLSTGATDQFIRKFWEQASFGRIWSPIVHSVSSPSGYSGRRHVVRWEDEKGEIASLAFRLKHLNHAIQSWRRGKPFWGKQGVAVAEVGSLNVTPYLGEMFSESVGVIVPEDEGMVAALWAYVSSAEFESQIRGSNKNLRIESSYILSRPFDLEHWQQVANEKYPDGLPEPYSSDPTQWLFDGTIPGSDNPLQVAMARLLGYRWPDQVDDGLDSLVSADGIVTLTSLSGQPPAEQQLRTVLRNAYGDDWSPELLNQLLRADDVSAISLESWLRDKKGFFGQHVKLFDKRPFLWQISDGHKEGFSAIVNYHKLTNQALNKLIYTYLGDWINRQRHAVEQEEAGAQSKLEAATELQAKLIAIATGEPPYDIYVRWKSLAEQPIGWNPDLNDGVRLNIRPFIEAGVLHAKVNVKWGKDRGRDPEVRIEPLAAGADKDLAERIALHNSVDRHNHLHFTNAEKRKARESN